MPTAYIETSIPSFYYTGRSDPLSFSRKLWTRQWWATIGAGFDLFSSPAVTVELNRGTLEKLKKLRIALVTELQMREINTDVLEIAQIYIKRLLMPDDADGDAFHLAIASYYNVSVLLTWNCKHLANPNKFGHIEKLNLELGIGVPLLTTPLNYLSEDDSNGT